jgi:hypothetical protein
VIGDDSGQMANRFKVDVEPRGNRDTCHNVAYRSAKRGQPIQPNSANIPTEVIPFLAEHDVEETLPRCPRSQPGRGEHATR